MQITHAVVVVAECLRTRTTHSLYESARNYLKT